MRHKQRPIKSSRHKSVTLLNDSLQTSFVHNNVRHMDNVMRLAFLENNDITPETWKDIDFNSLSTANILKRNIQRHLQQEQRVKQEEQQAKQQQHLFIQQQLLKQAEIQQQLQQHQLRLQQRHHNSRDKSRRHHHNHHHHQHYQHQSFQLQRQERPLYYDGGDESQQDEVLLEYDEDGQIDLSGLARALGARRHRDHQRPMKEHLGDADADGDGDGDCGDGGSSISISNGDPKYELSESNIFATAPQGASSLRIHVSSKPMVAHQSAPARAHSSSRRNMAQVNLTSSLATTAAAPSVPVSMSPVSVSPRQEPRDVHQAGSVNVSMRSEPRSMTSQNGDYFCDEPDCGKSFPSLRKLRHHKVVHSDDFPFHCQFQGCEKKFKRKFGIDLHSTTHFDLDPEMYRKTSNNSSLPFFGRRMQYSMCKPCGQKFKTVLEYQNHMLNHGREPFKCPVKGCGQTFSIWKSFQKHRASHYFNYYCQMDPRCEHFTSNLQLLKLHIYCCHFQRKLPANATLSSKDSALKRERPSQDGPFVVKDPLGVASEEEPDHDPGDELELEIDQEHDPGQEQEHEQDQEPDQEHEREHERELAHEQEQEQEQEHEHEHEHEHEQEEGVEEEEEEEEKHGHEEERKYQHEHEEQEPNQGESQQNGADNSIENSQKSDASTPRRDPRRDPRLRRNPPRSSTFGHQDYASISNGSSFAKITREMASPSSKRARTSTGSVGRSPGKTGSPKTPSKVLPRRSCATSVTPKKDESKLPLKVLPKRSAQRMPMSLIAAADGESTEDDNASEAGSSRNHSRNTNNSGPDGDNCESGFKCNLCDYKFSVRFQLTKHLSTHLELSPDMYSATADATVIQLSERRRREFFCDKCHVKFEQMSDLDNHMRKHGQRPYVCTFCQVPSTFRMAKQYLSHLYEHRFNYGCTMSPDCNFTINRKDALKLHIFRMHMNQKLPAYIENFANMADAKEWTEQ